MVMVHNTSYHESIKRTITEIFHGLISTDLKFTNQTQTHCTRIRIDLKNIGQRGQSERQRKHSQHFRSFSQVQELLRQAYSR